MDREQARQEIRRNWRQLITGITTEAKRKANGEASYICPFCGHGTNGDGLTRNPKSKEGNSLKCFGCGFAGDIIDLYQQAQGCDYNTALKTLAGQMGIEIDPYREQQQPPAVHSEKNNATERPQSRFEEAGGINIPPEAKTPQNALQSVTEAPANYAAYYVQCLQRLDDPAAAAYLQSRGISKATAIKFCIGFDPAADPANAPGAMGDEYRPHPTPRLIIPTGTEHYIARRTDGGSEYKKMNPAGSKPGIFNSRALYAQDVQEVFITEGAFDALSIIEAGAAAIALNSTANTDSLIKQLEERRTDATLIICLDNDEAGKKAAAKLREGLQRLNISHITADICAGYKDPNEALTGNREAFIAAIEQAQRQTAAKPDNTRLYIDELMSGEIARFKRDKKTGFANLDEQAGGLYSGLYVLAAISSLGKTSFALQLADQLAAGGEDVLFFSLEQSRLELVSKSLARRTAQQDRENAVTSLAIRKGYLPAQVLKAAADYKAAVADRISIIEGNFACNISFIGDYIRRYVEKNKSRPVCFIDYLQILQPADDARRQSTKETVDTTITELKRISRELDLTIIVISSVNRANYLTPIDFESLKESGGVEFTADVVWGLQLQCLNDPLFDAEKKIKEKREKVKQAKAENPRKIELSCLKNRYGISNYSCYFNYYPANDLFTEDGGTADEWRADGWANAKRV